MITCTDVTSFFGCIWDRSMSSGVPFVITYSVPRGLASRAIYINARFFSSLKFVGLFRSRSFFLIGRRVCIFRRDWRIWSCRSTDCGVKLASSDGLFPAFQILI